MIRSLKSLKAQTDACRACPIGALATQSVVGSGPRHAPMMLVGEQPGDHEDLAGAPFVGPAGRLLRAVMTHEGLDPDSVYMTNAVKHFKFTLRGKRRLHKTPGQLEALACLHWLEDEIDFIRPKAIIALGARAARSLLGHPVAVTRERGTWQRRADGIPVFVTVHPSSILRLQGPEREHAIASFGEELRRAFEECIEVSAAGSGTRARKDGD